MKALLLTATLCIASGLTTVQADDVIYKYRMSDGSTAYTQERSGGGELEDVMRVPSTPKAVSKKMAQRELQQMQEKAAQLESERLQRQQQERRIQQAEQAIALSETALVNNLEPLPEERQGIAGGGSRLSAAYWMRLRAMEQSVDLARERMEMLDEEIDADN